MTDTNQSKIFVSESMMQKKQTRVALLERLLLKAKDYYYNQGKFMTFRGEEVTDAVYDKYEEELRRLHPTSKVLRTVRAKTKAPGRKVVKLPFYLGSLDKVWAHDSSAEDWLADHATGNYVISDKLDGYSVPIVRKDGKWSVYSAGDDSGKAMDISHLAEFIKLPDVDKDLIVRGELLISRGKFAKHGTDFKNSRNMVASIVTRIKPHKSAVYFDFVAHELLQPRMAPSKQFAFLKRLGFNVVPHKLVAANIVTTARLVKFLQARKAASKYDIDGIVIAQDKSVPLTVGSNPSSVVAFKDNSQEEIVTATVKSVEWTASKHGYLKPVVHIKPVEISGVTISKCSGKNAYTIVNGWPKRSEKANSGKKPMPIGPGAKVKLVRSGGVIPDILEVLKAATSGKPSMPDADFEWTKTGIDIVETTQSDLSYDKRTATFFRTLGVEGLDVSTISKLADAGLDTVGKILKAKPVDFLEVPSIKDRSARKLYENIQAKLHDIPLHVLMDATGIFGRGMGQRKILPVLKKYPKLLSTTWTQTECKNKLMEVDGYSSVTATQFAAALPKFKLWLKKAETVLTWKMPVETIKRGSALTGQSVVFTGFRDKGLEMLIGQHGGRVASGVTSTTTVLLVSNKNDTSSKVKKAKELGTVKVMTPDQFVAHFKIK